ncbi:PadR family transcriptional regulator [Haloplasma contractile]|nr:PadR family transcriptional regulator [Haloplasma contractile]
MIVLHVVAKKDIYGYELVQKVNEVIEVKEGTIYPLLKRLTNENYFDTYYEKSSEGPRRKYYRLTSLGKEHYRALLNEWKVFSKNIDRYIGG